MIYLWDNPLLKEPLRPEHIKLRLLGHWGSSLGLSFIYVHLNRLIIRYDLGAIFLAGPGHGAPSVLAPIYLEGAYSEVYPKKGENHELFICIVLSSVVFVAVELEKWLARRGWLYLETI